MPTRRATEQETTVPLPDDGPNYDEAPVAPDPDPGNETRTGPNETAKGSQPAPVTGQAMIGAHQLRVLAVLMSKHGIRTDTNVYDWLTLRLGREITSRKDITAVEAAVILRELEDTPEAATPEVWAALAAPFPPEETEKLPKILRRDDPDKGRCNNDRYSADGYYCGGHHARAMHLDYVGHAGITMRLNNVVTPAGWSWEPVSWADGLPTVGREFWIRLTIMGVTKYGVGDDYGNSSKQAIGDALRNAAMRFGIGTYLWSKSEAALALRQATDDHEQTHPHEPAPREAPELDADLRDKGTADLLMLIGDYADRAGKTFTDYTAAWRNTFSPPLSVPDLDDLPAETVARAVMSIRGHMGGGA